MIGKLLAGCCALLVTFLLFGAVCMVGTSNRSGAATSQSARAAESADDQIPSPVSVEEVPPLPGRALPPRLPIRVAAMNLDAAYIANEVAAGEEYSGRTLEVRGFVSRIDKDIFGGVHVLLIGIGELNAVDASMNSGR